MRTSFDYGQEYAQDICADYEVDIDEMAHQSVDIPEGDYADMR